MEPPAGAVCTPYPYGAGRGGVLRSASSILGLLRGAIVTALMEFTSHVAGKNAQVAIYDDRIEWTTAGKLTITGRRPSSEMIPVRAITSVTTRKDGLRNHAVSIVTAGNTIDMRVSKAEAEQVKATITRLMLA